MQTEIEAKFLNVDHEEIREKLKVLGAKLAQPMRLMRRVVIDYPDRRMQAKYDGWVRIRDEGDRVTLTYKQTEENKFGGAKEIEVIVSDYEKTIQIFQSLGLIIHTDQETRRETWTLNGAEIVLDEWPWLNPYIEIESTSEEAVQRIAKKLGFDWNIAVFGSVTTAYRKQYPDITRNEHISMIPEIKFNLPQPDWFIKEKAK